MHKVALFIALLVSTLFGCSSGFQSCLQKVQDYHVIKENFIKIPITSTQAILYSDHFSSYDDPFLHLQLQTLSTKVSYPFKLHHNFPSSELALINSTISCGRLHLSEDPFFASFSSSKETGVVLNGCCAFLGIATSKGVITKPFLEHFLSKDRGVYGDIGVRFKNKNSKIVVATINPFFTHNPFKVGDVVLKVEQQTYSLTALQQKILFSKVGRKLHFMIKRNKKTLHFNVAVAKRYGGGYISDSFLENIGIYLDQNLKVIRSTESHIKPGDVIKVVEGKKVQTYQDIQQALSHLQGTLDIGIERKGFFFFVHLKEF